MKHLIISLITAVVLISCSQNNESENNQSNDYTVPIPEGMYSPPPNFNLQWEDYDTRMKPYHLLNLEGKSVSEINKLYGNPIFEKVDTIYFGKILMFEDTNFSGYYYHLERPIAYLFSETPKIALHEIWWKMKRDNVNYRLVLFCIHKNGELYPVEGYAHDESKPLPE